MENAKHRLWAVTPLDGRYAPQIESLNAVFSEAALIKCRLQVEMHWLLHLSEVPELTKALGAMPPAMTKALNESIKSVPNAWLKQVKLEEQTTKHDVKAVEYVLREHLRGVAAKSPWLAMLHFACTSEDINNLSYALMLKDARDKVLIPALDNVLKNLIQHTEACAAMPMLSRTHGQSATPTTMGKELAVFGQRLLWAREACKQVIIRGKINGAVGNFNAHSIAFSDVNWNKVGESFVTKRLGITWNPYTTQIENHDWMASYADSWRHVNTILIGMCRDIWGYISLGYFTQKATAGEVGSSTMPHKVNPIDFENAEGNLGLANAIAVHLSDKLPISRWQRDLSDSTVQRAWGEQLGHSLLAYSSLLRGLQKISPAPKALARDLDNAWEVLTEAVQTVMRRYGVVDAYERLKAVSRGQAFDQQALKAVVEGCSELPADVRQKLLQMKPSDYVGIAPQLATNFVKDALKSIGS